MQPRVLHLFNKLNLNPGEVPSSNLIFVPSRRENKINTEEKRALCQECWPFHEAVIKELRLKVILCFGKTAGKYLRVKLDANTMIDEFVEANNRRWRSQAFSGKYGVKVIVATHPSIADWTTPASDPSEMIKRVVNRNA